MPYNPSAENLAQFPQLKRVAEAGAELPRKAFYNRPPKTLRILSGGQLYFDSNLELDTDGWPGGSGRGDRHYQTATSYTLADKSPIDANRVPYFVLPQPTDWVKGYKIWLGDVAAVLYKGKLAFAVFADFGGTDTIGEGSIELLRLLGMERLQNGRILNRGTPPGAVTIVFPGSRPALKYNSIEEIVSETRRRGEEHFAALMRSASDLTAASVSLPNEIVRLARREHRRFGGCAENREPLNSRIGEYWQALGKSYMGTDRDQYWSAAFISFVVCEAGAGSSFNYSRRHSAYVHRAIHDREDGITGMFWAHRPQDVAIAPGDLLAMNQGGTRTIAFEEARYSDRYPSHCDIVVDADASGFRTIGGNVGADTVGEKTFVWKGSRLVRSDNNDQQVFAVLRPPALGID